ncbi:MAG: ATP-binding protein [Acidimicrobiia bacterium]|nr:ATP-binding protein [Acidimicrobiia bacterium]
MLVVAAIAAVIGIALGVAVGRMTTEHASPSEPSGADDAESAGEPFEDMLADAANHLEIGLVVASSTGHIVYRNAAASTQRGTHTGVLIDEHLDRILDRARTGERVVTSVELHGPPPLTLALVAEPMPDGAAVASIRDVSEQVHSDAIRTDFVANISHELKTPVGAIAVLAEALIDEADPEVVRRVSERMVAEAHRAVRTIDDLLELARIEVAPRDDEVVGLDAVVQAAIVRGRGVDTGRGIEVEALDMGDDVFLRVDGRQLVSALGNLVENAVKYSLDEGSVQVRTRIDDRFVEVMVADHGVGIPERDLDRIFERFYRVDRGRRRETGGSGLGLAIVRHVANSHGGDVLVSSSEGEGSTFVLRLPAAVIVSNRSADDRATGDAQISNEEEPSL